MVICGAWIRRMAAGALAVLSGLLLVTCAGPGLRSSTREDLIPLMGEIDAHLLDIQDGAGDPIEANRVRRHLMGLRENLLKASALELPHAGFRERARDAAETIRELEVATWTPETRGDYYQTLKSLCSGCHRTYGRQESGESQALDSWTACGRCHQAQYQDWKGSLHEEAWLDPVYRLSAGTPPKLECRGCHSMEPILARKISTEYSYRPVYRPYLQAEGVNCLSCHGRGDGTVAAARDLADAPCRPRKDERLLKPEFCGACHNPSHRAYDEWKLSTSGKTCTECHAIREGSFTHRMRGTRDRDLVRAALGWSCEIEKGLLLVMLTNRSGHKLPAEVPGRALRVAIRLDDQEELVLFRRAPKQSIGIKDNRLLPEETRRLERSLGSATRVRVEFWYQQSPLVMPEGWVQMGAWEKTLR
jgi:hypothetical protein